MGSLFWLIVFGVMLVLEIATLGLTSIWFAGGALVTFLLSFAVDNPYAEWVIFLAVSVLCLLALRPMFIDKFNARRERTNINRIIGQTARVTEAIDNFNSHGAVFLKGQEWTARNAVSDAVIPVGSKVIVREISGVKVLVEPISAEPKESEK
ncbi:MAG: NfeD family protein [Lachnospiraceae bacterium]|nr:NfeD family protein [Lachnospiraceae bacterium]